jgi:dTDP-4-dehydrorhamnose 3,5-epimerase
MKFKKNKFEDLLIYQEKTFKDNRGYFRELFKQKYFAQKYPFMYMSFSKKNVIRGLHLQLKKPQSKIITVLSGKILDVSLDCRKNSKTFGKFFKLILSDKNNKSILIPKGFAHGFCTLSNKVIMLYKCSDYRSAKTEIGILWNDKDLNINWPVKKPIISNKDRLNLSFKEFKKINVF